MLITKESKTLSGKPKVPYQNTVITSNFIAKTNQDKCTGCGKCESVCPVDAITMTLIEKPHSLYKKKKKEPVIDNNFCLGCGVCALQCKTGGVSLIQREKRVLTPETTFERVILQSLEKGTLENQLFDNPQSLTQGFMRGVIGGFLRLSPVKKALMSDTLRSSFLNFMSKGAKKSGKDWIEIV